MAWLQIHSKPLPEPVMAQFTDSYIRHQASKSYSFLSFTAWTWPCQLFPFDEKLCFST